MKIKVFKYILFFMNFLSCSRFTYAEVCISNQCFYNSMVKDICQHSFSSDKVQELEKLASAGYTGVKLQLAIFYDIQSVRYYKEVNDFGMINPPSIPNRPSPCDSIKD